MSLPRALRTHRLRVAHCTTVDVCRRCGPSPSLTCADAGRDAIAMHALVARYRCPFHCPSRSSSQWRPAVRATLATPQVRLGSLDGMHFLACGVGACIVQCILGCFVLGLAWCDKGPVRNCMRCVRAAWQWLRAFRELGSTRAKVCDTRILVAIRVLHAATCRRGLVRAAADRMLAPLAVLHWPSWCNDLTVNAQGGTATLLLPTC